MRRLIYYVVIMAVVCLLVQAAMAAPIMNEATKHYKTLVITRIEDQWKPLFVSNAAKISLGTIRIHVLVARDGKARGTWVTPNKSDNLLAQISLKAIRQAKLPPMPDDVAEGKSLEFELAFDSK